MENSVVRKVCRNFSFAPSGLAPDPRITPGLAPWAAFFRRFAAV